MSSLQNNALVFWRDGNLYRTVNDKLVGRPMVHRGRNVTEYRGAHGHRHVGPVRVHKRSFTWPTP